MANGELRKIDPLVTTRLIIAAAVFHVELYGRYGAKKIPGFSEADFRNAYSAILYQASRSERRSRRLVRLRGHRGIEFLHLVFRDHSHEWTAGGGNEVAIQFDRGRAVRPHRPQRQLFLYRNGGWTRDCGLYLQSIDRRSGGYRGLAVFHRNAAWEDGGFGIELDRSHKLVSGRARLHRRLENSGFVSGHRFRDAVSSLKSDAPSGARHQQSTLCNL